MAISPEQNVGNLSRTEHRIKNIAKGTTDPRNKFLSHDLTQILIKSRFQNLD